MRCFNHTDREAVGTCKCCNKGLCPECAVDLGYGLACKVHEQRAEALEAMVSRASQVQTTAQSAKYVAPAFTAFMGILFTGYGLFLDRGPKLLLLLGLGFLGYSLVVLVANRRAYGGKNN
jgi:hypothetical protein